MTPLRVLLNAYHLLDKKSRWTHSSFARDKTGETVYMKSADAAKWCARGALYIQGDANDLEARVRAEELLDRACMTLYGTGATSVNDGDDGYRRIRRAFREAVKLT